jgi:hypothetical protein
MTIVEFAENSIILKRSDEKPNLLFVPDKPIKETAVKYQTA